MNAGISSILISVGVLIAASGLSIEPGHGRTAQPDSSHQFVIRQVSPSVISGPTPLGIETMRRLKRMGVNTLVSVDGARPDVESATAVGMNYVHLPSGYDGVSADVLAGLTRVMQERNAPVFVHCHHGKHRGPAAAAICSMIAGELNPAQASGFLELAGTSPNYPGLWKSVSEFEPIPPETPLPELKAVADVEPLVDAMVRIDARFDELQKLASPTDDHRVSSSASDVAELRSAAHLLVQELREASRLFATEQPAGFGELFETSVRQAVQITQEIESQPFVVPPTLTQLRQSCTDCHNQYRN